jgi:BclB C-terminal domain-containing protein
MKKKLLILSLFISIKSIGQVGIGTTTPGTTLDVNGAITNRETQVAVIANAATIPSNTSLVQLTGAATATVNVTAPAAPNAGQRLIVFNNTTGGFGATINSITIPNGQAGEFIYSSSNWRSLNPAPPASSIVTYASNLPVTLTTIAGGLAGTGALIGFGSSVSSITVSGATIDLTGGTGVSMNFGFTAPRNGTLKSISAFFSTAAGLSLTGTTVTIKAQLYKSNSIGSNIFSPVAGTLVTLSPGLTGILSAGTTSTGILSGLSIEVTAQSRYILVYSSAAAGLSLITTTVGYASAGLSIE